MREIEITFKKLIHSQLSNKQKLLKVVVVSFF